MALRKVDAPAALRDEAAARLEEEAREAVRAWKDGGSSLTLGLAGALARMSRWLEVLEALRSGSPPAGPRARRRRS